MFNGIETCRTSATDAQTCHPWHLPLRLLRFVVGCGLILYISWRIIDVVEQPLTLPLLSSTLVTLPSECCTTTEGLKGTMWF